MIDLKAPPTKPGMWLFGLIDHPWARRIGFTEKTWFEARAKACTFFGCEPGDVVCVGRPV